jgi:hypothetical protein
MCGSRARSGHQPGKAGATLSQGPRGSGQVPTHTGGTEEHRGTLFGVSVIHTLREPLERLVGDRPQLRLSPLFQGLEPYPDGWRASVRKPDTLPHYPMDLHRGRCPDGRQLNFGRA